MNIIVKTKLQKDTFSPLLVTGMAGIVASLAIFLFPEWSSAIMAKDSIIGIAIMNYGIAAAYFILLLIRGIFTFRKPVRNLEYLFLFLVMALISCFSLNREIRLFQPSVEWLQVYLVVLSVAAVGYFFRENLPRPAQFLLWFCLGAGTLLMLYFSFYLLPFYLVGLIGAFLLGFTLHLFVPLFFTICLAVAAGKAARADRPLLYCFYAGVALPLFYTLGFLFIWQKQDSDMTYHLHTHEMAYNRELPRWVKLAQQLPANSITEKLIKTNMLYQTTSRENGLWRMPMNNFRDLQQHDPLVLVATLLNGEPDLEPQEKVKLLESMYDARHHAEQRLWRGDNLSTGSVITHVRLFPQYRIGYTEKTLTVKNSMNNRWSQQEAIYTFYLPEGSVVTSLSLWVNGVEEKGYLTTTSKADSAYNTIVGGERRDPSVVHWQEGNRVSVRVFPCMPEEARRFKIGVTSPLRQEGEKLVYENIYFDGPSAADAKETATLRFDAAISDLDLPHSFRSSETNAYSRHGSYQQDWEVSFLAPELSSSTFIFEGIQYQMQPHRPVYSSFSPAAIYLDLNASWTKTELEQVRKAAGRIPVFVYDNRFVELTKNNSPDAVAHLLQNRFSLFPFHRLPKAGQALVVSKSDLVSPNLKDLEGSSMAAGLAMGLPQQPRIRFFNLGHTLSPYLKSLKELRVLHYDHGSPEELSALISGKRFKNSPETNEQVLLGESGLLITKKPVTEYTEAGAPDHLMRLFAYNHLMHQIGTNFFNRKHLEESLIQEASQAYVVSPLSSLIVLETLADYQRFDIQKSRNSLGNAAVHSSGSVPEPEEWALIILALTVAVFFVVKPYLFR